MAWQEHIFHETAMRVLWVVICYNTMLGIFFITKFVIYSFHRTLSSYLQFDRTTFGYNFVRDVIQVSSKTDSWLFPDFLSLNHFTEYTKIAIQAIEVDTPFKTVKVLDRSTMRRTANPSINQQCGFSWFMNENRYTKLVDKPVESLISNTKYVMQRNISVDE